MGADNGIVFEYLDTKIIPTKRAPQHFSFGRGPSAVRSYSRRKQLEGKSTNILLFFFKKLIYHEQIVSKERVGNPHHYLF